MTTPGEPETEAGRRLLVELSENPLDGARYAHGVVALRLPAIEAEARALAATASPGLVLVRKDSGGVFPDGTTNHPAIDFNEPPTLDAASPGLDVERLHGAMATVESELTRQGVIVGRDADLSDYVDAIVIKYAALAADRETRQVEVHVNDGSSHDRAMAWSEGHTAGYEEAEDVLRQMLVAIPAVGLVEGANRYDTDDKHILHVWRDGKSYDIEVRRAALAADRETPA